MDRAGQKAPPLSGDELKVIFEVVSQGEAPENARQRLSGRDRSTVNRAYNVVSEFERRNMPTCSDEDASDTAKRALYGTTPGYVQALFLRWKGWKNPDSARPDVESALHRRELFYFGQRLRDRLSLPFPVDVVKHLPALPPLWQRESASEFRDSQSDEEASVAKEWGYGPVDATKLSLFEALRQHLKGNPCSGELEALTEVYPRYCKGCQGAYQGLMVQYAGRSVAEEDEEARVMAIAVLAEVWYRLEKRGASLISPQVFAAKDDIVALPWEVRLGAWGIRRRSEGEAKEVVKAFRQLAGKATKKGKLRDAQRLYRGLAEKRAAFRRLLLPDAGLRKLILSGHCELCP